MSNALVDEVSTESSPREASSLPEPVDESLFSNSSASVHEEGLEPPRLAAPEPKSGASANSATRAGSLGCVGGGIARAGGNVYRNRVVWMSEPLGLLDLLDLLGGASVSQPLSLSLSESR